MGRQVPSVLEADPRLLRAERGTRPMPPWIIDALTGQVVGMPAMLDRTSGGDMVPSADRGTRTDRRGDVPVPAHGLCAAGNWRSPARFKRFRGLGCASPNRRCRSSPAGRRAVGLGLLRRSRQPRREVRPRAAVARPPRPRALPAQSGRSRLGRVSQHDSPIPMLRPPSGDPSMAILLEQDHAPGGGDRPAGAPDTSGPSGGPGAPGPEVPLRCSPLPPLAFPRPPRAGRVPGQHAGRVVRAGPHGRRPCGHCVQRPVQRNRLPCPGLRARRG